MKESKKLSPCPFCGVVPQQDKIGIWDVEHRESCYFAHKYTKLTVIREKDINAWEYRAALYGLTRPSE